MGVPNYCMFNYFERSLECVVLEGGEYRVDASGKDDEKVRPCAFAGLIIPLATLWAE